MKTRLVPIQLPMDYGTTWYLDYAITPKEWKNYCSGSRDYCLEKRKELRKELKAGRCPSTTA